MNMFNMSPEVIIMIACFLVASILGGRNSIGAIFSEENETYKDSWFPRIAAAVLMIIGVILGLDLAGKYYPDFDSKKYILILLIVIMALILVFGAIYKLVKKADSKERSWSKEQKSYWEQNEEDKNDK